MSKTRLQQATKNSPRADGLEVIRDEENEYLENMPESLQGSEKYESAENAVGCLESVLSALDEAIEELEEKII